MLNLLKQTMHIAVLLLVATALTGFGSAEKRYKVKSGVITYESSGMETGVHKLYFDDYGKREARYVDSTVTVMGFSNKNRSIQIIDGEWAYHVDPAKNTATKMNYVEAMEMFAQEGKQVKPTMYSVDAIKAMGGEKIGDAEVLGKKCDIYHVPQYGMYLSLWKGVPLRIHMNFMGMQMTTEAVNIETDVAIKPQLLALPVGLTIQDQSLADMPQMDPEAMAQAAEGLGQMQAAFGQALSQAQTQQAQQNVAVGANGNFAEEAFAGAMHSAESQAKGSINNATRQGVRNLFGNVLKSAFD